MPGHRFPHTLSPLSCVLCVLVLLPWSCPSAGALQIYRAQQARGPLAVTAYLSAADPAQIMTGFSAPTGKPAAVQTRAAAVYDNANLHFLVECLEPNMDGLVAQCTLHDGDVFSDDCVEIFISPNPQRKPYYHFVANALGTQYEEKVRDKSWHAPWTVKPARGDDRWTLQITIPFAALGGRPAEGSVWWFNVDRQRQAAGKLELSSWSPTASDFHDLRHFAALVFDDQYVAYLAQDVLAPWKQLATELPQRAKIDPNAARRLNAKLVAIGKTLQPVRQAVQAGKTGSLSEFASLLEIGRTALAQLDEARAELEASIAAAEAIIAMRKLARPGQSLLAYSVRAITDRRILPTPDPPESVSPSVSLRACRGEYEPASFVVYPLEGPVVLDVSVTDLKGPAAAIPAAAVDLRTVKRWYQAGGVERFPINRGLRLLTPELLLKDDQLVRVDHEKKENYVKLTFPDHTVKWLWISSPKTTPQEKDVSVEAMPIRDAETLQPVAIPRYTAKQFWVTVHVPQDAPPGNYQAAIELRSAGKLLATLPLRLEVLPFDLQPNHLESSIYFHWGLNLQVEGRGTVQHRTRSVAQYTAELKDLLAHGVDNPTLGVPFDSGLLPLALKLRRQVGLKNDHLYYLTAYTWATPPEKVKQIIKIAKQFGFSDVYFYGRDEARGEKLKAQRATWQAIHEAGGKVFVAGSKGHNFPAMGDLQDLLVCYGDPSKEEAALWHSKGHKIFCYANPQSGIEAPETYRRNFGLLLDVNDYDGGMTYIYYHGWNDYNIGRYRQHNFVYPTADGVIDTIQWEGYREGLDDLRYLATLRKAIHSAEQSGAARAEDIAAAKAFLDHMDVSGDLYALRDQMIAWILKLTPTAQ